LVDSFLVDETFTCAIFFSCIKEFLKKGTVDPYPGRHSIWVMDGASIHMDENIVDYLFSVGIIVIYLPPYCPFYNPIEIVFSILKRMLKKHYKKKGTEQLLLTTILNSLGYHNCEGLFQKCGYQFDGLFNPYRSFPTLQ